MAYSLKDILKDTQIKGTSVNIHEIENKIANAKAIDAKAIGAKAIGSKLIGVKAIGAKEIENQKIKAIEHERAIAKEIEHKKAIAKENAKVLENEKAIAKEKAIEDAKTKAIEDAKAFAKAIEHAKEIDKNINIWQPYTQQPYTQQPYTQQPLLSNVPKKIFIVPYRNRKNQKKEFLRHMKEVILVDEPEGSYEIYFAHQYDSRPFNRGAMKNIGFLAIKKKYPLHYKQITFIFNDVDTYPSIKGMIGYDTVQGVVKHYYGYKFALGGIFSIKGIDFERILGFPNFWGWGLEDNVIQDRALASGLTIDRSEFYNMQDPRITRAFDGFERVISKRDSVVYKRETPDNITSLKNVKWVFNNEYINITHFESGMDPDNQDYSTYDIRSGNKLLIPNGYDRRSWKFNGIPRSVEK
jgi:hypothetical protein